MDKYKQLTDMLDSVASLDLSLVNNVDNARKLSKTLEKLRENILNGIDVSDGEIAFNQKNLTNVMSGKDLQSTTTVQATMDVEMFQLGIPKENLVLEFSGNTLRAPEHGTLIQKLWKVKFADGKTGHAIISDTSNVALSTLVNAQVSHALKDAPDSAVEDLDLTIPLADLESEIDETRDLTKYFNTLEKPGLVCRQLRDININDDPALEFLSQEQKETLMAKISNLNREIGETNIAAAQTDLLGYAKSIGFYSTSIGPTPNMNYSDLKRFKVINGSETITVVASIPIISWGNGVTGIALRNSAGPKDKTNRKDDGHSYIVDMGGIDPVILNGAANPLPAIRYFNNGPPKATEEEGALERYEGGKCLGLNTTMQEVTFTSYWYEKDGDITVTVPPLSAIWKLDRATFDLGNRHAYYNVYSASRAPACGFMGVTLAPKQNRLGRGRPEIASGVTLANGISKTGKTFNQQNENGPILSSKKKEMPSGLKGVTCSFDGHGVGPKDMLDFLQKNSFTKGTQYLTIPANATLETVEDVLIPKGQLIPQVTQAVGTLFQFRNGTYVKDGGPARSQPGLIPFLPGTLAYTPEWHINWVIYNCGTAICDGEEYLIENPAKDTKFDSWVKPGHNSSFGPPGPNPDNSRETGFNPLHPDTFDPVQLRCNIKTTKCDEYVDKIKGSVNGEISLSMLPKLEQENKILITEAPSGAMRGWVKFLVVNCPVPVVATIKKVGEEEVVIESNNSSSNSSGNCVTCSCSRSATTVSINGDLNPIWLDEDSEGNDTIIGNRVLKLKVGDSVVIKSTSGVMHGVALRLDGITAHTTIDNTKTLSVMQDEVLTEIKEKLTINNESALSSNIAALQDELIQFHSGVPITFTQRSNSNSLANPDGITIADFTPKTGSEGTSGTVSCTVHGSSMSFRFSVCP